MSVAVIILAAGGSSRLGRPKQLLKYRNETLLNRAIRLAHETGASPVVAVLGANYESIRASIEDRTSIPVYNDHWRQGIASSIHEGVRALSVCAPDAASVLLMGCDQPRLTAEHLRALFEASTAAEAQAIVTSTYAGAHGVPAVFPRSTFAELRALRGDKGARSIIERGDFTVIDVEFAGGEVDIDSPEDLVRLG